MLCPAFAAVALVLTVTTGHALDNPGFEVPDKGAGGWEYAPGGASWTFAPSAGVSGPNGPWRCNSVSPDPLGNQFGYLQNASTISQDLTDLVVGAMYVLHFYESYRTAMFPSNDLSVVLDEGLGTEITIYTNAAVTNTTWEPRQTAEFVAAKTSYTLTFRTTNPLGGDRSTLIDGIVIDVVDLPGPPALIALDPEDDATNVVPRTDLVMTFSEDVVPGAGDITITNLTDATAIVIPATNAQVSVAGPILTIDPATNLLALTDYAVLIDTNAIEDNAGSSFPGIADNTNWNFTTAPPDTNAPAVTGLTPTNGAYAVQIDTDLVATFDENIRKGTGDIGIRESVGDAVVETIAVTSAAVTVNGAAVTVNPAGDLAVDTAYYVEIAPGAIEDLSGNPFAGIAGKATWSFTTAATTPISYHPITGDDDSEISSSKTYTHALDFGNQPGGGGLAVVNEVVFANGGPGGFPAIGGSSQTVGTGSSTLPNSHNGNGSADPYLVDGGMEDLVHDMIYGDETGVITLTGLTPGRPYRFRLYNRQYGPNAGTNRDQDIGFDTDGVGSGIAGAEHTATFAADNASRPDPSFATFSQVYGLTYDYVLSPGVSRLTVFINRKAGDTGTYHLYGLTNEEVPPPDTTGPAVNDLYPADDAADVLVVRNMVATFDEDIVAGPGSITITNLTDATGIVIPASNAQVSVAGPVLTIDPTNDLAPLSDYAVLIDTNAVKDVAGNPFAGVTNTTTWNFTTAELDLTGPTVTTLIPADDADDMSTGADLVIVFDEEVQQGTGNILIKRSDDNTVFETIDAASTAVIVNAAEVIVNPTGNLAVATGYYVEIEPGAIEDISGNDFAGIADNSTWNFTTLAAGVISYHQIADDADSGIVSNKTYTHTIDFGNAGAATVNGVVFGTDVNIAAGGRTNSGTRTYGPNLAAGTPPAVTGGITNVFRDFRYNGPDLGYVELAGLTPGRMYDLRLYERAWDYELLVRTYYAGYDLGGDGSVELTTPKIDQNRATLVPPWMTSNVSWAVSYVYRADASGKIRVVIDLADDQTGTYHLYGLTNEELPADGSIYWIGAGASNITATSSWACATVNTNLDAAVLVWDLSDKGAGSPNDWTNSVSLGAQAPGAVTGAATNLLPDTRYTFRFYGTNSLPTNGWSAATDFATAFSAAQTPVFTHADTSAWNIITLDWQDNASNETAYILLRSSTGADGPYSEIATLRANVTSYEEVVARGTTYHYRLAATNAANGSATDFAACQTHVVMPPTPPFDDVLFRDDFSETDVTFNQNVEDNLSLFGSVVDSMTQDSPTYTTSGAIGAENGNATWRIAAPSSSAFVPNYDFALNTALTNAGWFTVSLKDLTPGGSWAALAVFDNNALDAQNINDLTVGLGALFGPGPGGAIQVWSQGNMATNPVTTPAPPFDVTFAITNISGFGPDSSFDYEILVGTTVVESGAKTNIDTTTNYIMVEGWAGPSTAGELEVRTASVPPDRGMVLIVR